MRFLTDLTKGILGKPDSAEMWSDIISNIPDEIFLKKDLKILNFAFGHATEADIISKRMKTLGRTPIEIKKSMYLVDKYSVFSKAAMRKGYTNVFKQDFINWETDMKFDVVIGNPPYQNPGKSKGQKLWYKFIFKCSDLVKEDGYLAMVTPTSWIRGGVNHGKAGVLKDIFGVKQLVIASFRDITKTYFPRIGIEIGWWVMQNKLITEKTKFILKDADVELDLTGIEVMSPVADSRAIGILNKFIDNKYKKEEIIYFNYKNSDRENEKAESTNTHTVKHWVHGCSQKSNDHYTYLENRFNNKLDFKKVMFLIGSRFWQPHVDEENVGVIAQGFAIPIKDNWTKESILSIYESKLWKLIFFNFQLEQNGFMKNAIVRRTPAMDMTKEWTDDEIYKYFNLTEEEIEYIEHNVK